MFVVPQSPTEASSSANTQSFQMFLRPDVLVWWKGVSELRVCYASVQSLISPSSEGGGGGGGGRARMMRKRGGGSARHFFPESKKTETEFSASLVTFIKNKPVCPSRCETSDRHCVRLTHYSFIKSFCYKVRKWQTTSTNHSSPSYVTCVMSSERRCCELRWRLCVFLAVLCLKNPKH